MFATQRLFSPLHHFRDLRALLFWWFAAIVICLCLDLLAADEQWHSAQVLNLATLATFIGLTAATYRANPGAIALALAATATFQTTLCVLQYLGFDWAWRLWQTVQAIAPDWVKVDDYTLANEAEFTFDASGRVRGSHIYVHIFTAVQSTLVAALIGLTLVPPLSIRNAFMTRLLVQLGAVAGVVGLFLTFSRSGALALVIAGGIAVFLGARSTRTLGTAVVTVAIIIASIGNLDLSRSNQIQRLVGGQTTSASASDRMRLEQYEYAWRTFLESPLLGESIMDSSGEELDLPIHSVPLRYLNDYGLVGLSLYGIVFLLLANLFLSRLRRDTGPARPWAVVGLCALAAVASDSWTHSSGFLRRDVFHAILLAALIGPMLACSTESPSRRANRTL
jgi:hypothetical protein